MSCYSSLGCFKW